MISFHHDVHVECEVVHLDDAADDHLEENDAGDLCY